MPYSNKKPYDGLLDPLAEVRLRIGRVDNPTINRPNDSKIEPLNTPGIVNLQSGKIAITWIDGAGAGGVVRPQKFTGDSDYKSVDVAGHGSVVHDFSFDSSEREMLTLSHPMMWANNENWCGMHYLPPVGSIVIVGFRKNNMPVLLGYLQSNYALCSPINTGEIMMKGYGNNHIHLKQSDKMELKTWSVKDAIDLTDPTLGKKNDSNCTVYAVLNANDKSFRVRVLDNDRPDGKDYDSFFKVEPDNIYMEITDGTNSSDVTIKASNVTINTGTFTVKAPNGIYLN